MGYESCDTPVAIEKRVYPQQPVMRRRSRYYFFSSSQTAVGVLKMSEESRHCAGGDRDMLTNAHIAISQLTRHHS